MEVDKTVVNYICTTLYNIIPIEQSIRQLWGYDDRNFSLVDLSNHQTYILKIINENDSKPELTDIVDEVIDSAHAYFEAQGSEFVVPKLIRTSANKLSTLVGINVKNSITCDTELKHCNVKLFEFFDGITLNEFVRSRRAGNRLNLAILSETYFQVGRLCNHLFEFLHTQNHLIEPLAKCRQGFSWQLLTCEPFLRNQLKLISSSSSGDEISLIEQVLNEYNAIKGRLDLLPKFVVHGDLSTRNILMEGSSPKPTCLIDFGDVQVGNQLTDLAVAMLYAVLEQHEANFKECLEKIPAYILQGYQSANKVSSRKLAEEHLDLALTLMKLRLCQSAVNAKLASKRDPANNCVRTTLKDGFKLLEILVRDPKYSDPIGMAKLWRELSPS